jgi:hypothetical protein
MTYKEQQWKGNSGSDQFTTCQQPLPTEGLPTPQTMAESVHNLGVMKQEKDIGMDVHQATIAVAVRDNGQADYGMHSGDESSHDSRVRPRTQRQSIGDLRRRNLGRLVT